MDNNTKQIIGGNIRAKREALGLSQEELAQKVGKQTATYIAFIEKGERNITTVDLMAIAKQLGTTVAVLIGEDKKAKTPSVVDVLRSAKELSKADREKIEAIYNFAKNKKDE
ncbi:MAG: helix-turn-helix transcriptional regulator [Candidatus Magasanikbacteria bacterium]|jgi:transcriptional regulator with XRE-family HTH domain